MWMEVIAIPVIFELLYHLLLILSLYTSQLSWESIGHRLGGSESKKILKEYAEYAESCQPYIGSLIYIVTFTNPTGLHNEYKIDASEGFCPCLKPSYRG